MSKKYVMLPWERYQILLASESGETGTETAEEGVEKEQPIARQSSEEKAIAGGGDGSEFASEPHSPGSAAVREHTQHVQKDSLDSAAVREPEEHVQTQSPGGGAVVDSVETPQREAGAVNKAELSLLRPPGVPARRWMIWK